MTIRMKRILNILTMINTALDMRNPNIKRMKELIKEAKENCKEEEKSIAVLVKKSDKWDDLIEMIRGDL